MIKLINFLFIFLLFPIICYSNNITNDLSKILDGNIEIINIQNLNEYNLENFISIEFSIDKKRYYILSNGQIFIPYTGEIFNKKGKNILNKKFNFKIENGIVLYKNSNHKNDDYIDIFINFWCASCIKLMTEINEIINKKPSKSYRLHIIPLSENETIAIQIYHCIYKMKIDSKIKLKYLKWLSSDKIHEYEDKNKVLFDFLKFTNNNKIQTELKSRTITDESLATDLILYEKIGIPSIPIIIHNKNIFIGYDKCLNIIKN